ncbi:hypothetical protein PHPALM_29518 [Phytophthora palmivora]|uniref:Uncharacterized protein n=1 Tax=Phytophthora palmivora TaxID=4796 RepID=A0A2P4X7D9_9STRA|nr:hypothetical protein PHPALM_29518 [Phytophthora palmivora]
MIWNNCATWLVVSPTRHVLDVPDDYAYFPFLVLLVIFFQPIRTEIDAIDFTTKPRGDSCRVDSSPNLRFKTGLRHS